MFARRGDKVLTKAPVPEPSVVFGFAVVGPGAVFQHTPRAVTVAAPPTAIVPPLLAAMGVIPVTAVVVRFGSVVINT